MTPQFVYKVVSKEQWDLSRKNNSVMLGEHDQEFIHLCTHEQLERVVEKFWRNQPHIVLKLLSSKLQGNLKLENNPGGTTKYFHLYEGFIPLDAVCETKFINI